MKKKMIYLGMILFSILYMFPVYAGSTVKDECIVKNISSTMDVKLPNTVHSVILLIQIAVPILLVIFGMLDLFKGLTAQKEDEIKKGQQTFVKRLLSAAIIFFVIAIVKLLIGAVTENGDTTIMDCANCFINGVNSSGICK